MNPKQHKEKETLKHEPIPPYKTVFYIVFALAVFYLIAIIIVGCK